MYVESSSFFIRTLLTLSLAALSIQSTRADELPRVKIANGTLVDTEGVPLRGATFFVDLYGVPDMRDNEEMYHAYFKSIFEENKLSCVRIGPWMGDWKYDLANNEEHRKEYLYVIDKVVDWCAECKVYAIVNLHTQYKSEFNLEKAKAYWSLVAPRYKDQTHVIYELSNEPEPKSSLANMADAYCHVKSIAPDTHQILFSHVSAVQLSLDELPAATEGVDFTNASIGFHCYDNVLMNVVQWEHAQKIRAAGYPIICTEFLSLTNNNDMPIRYEALMHCMMRAEERKMAWVSWGPFAQYRNPNKKGWGNSALRYGPSLTAAMRRYGIDFTKGTQWPSDGRYRLKSVSAEVYLARATEGAWADVIVAKEADDSSSIWLLERFDGNMYRLRSADNDKLCLHGKFDDDKPWQSAVSAEFNNDWNSQKIQLLRTSEDTYQLRCRWGDLFFTANENGKVQSGPLTNELNQHWKLEPLTDANRK
jgi:hypothetical protein